MHTNFSPHNDDGEKIKIYLLLHKHFLFEDFLLYKRITMNDDDVEDELYESEELKENKNH